MPNKTFFAFLNKTAKKSFHTGATVCDRKECLEYNANSSIQHENI